MKKWLFLCLLTGTFQTMHAQITMRDRFVNMPDSVLHLLTKNNRLDFLDFLDSKMPAIVKNKFYGKSELKELTDNYLCLALTSTSQIEMLLLPQNDSTKTICLITNFSGPKKDAQIAFYAADWQPLSTADHISLPQFSDFWDAPNLPADELKRLQDKFNMQLITIEVGKQSNTLTFRLNTDILSTEDAQAVKPYLHNISFGWDGQKFVSAKP